VNEIADRLAGKAVLNDVSEIDKSDLQIAIRQNSNFKKPTNSNKVPTTNDLKSLVLLIDLFIEIFAINDNYY
jgi:hypothetical protein